MLIGWDDGRGAFWIQNSWGTGWGQAGRAWLPYSQIGHIWEAWTTLDAPDATEAGMIPTTPTSSIGVATIDSDPTTRLINLADGTYFDPAPGQQIAVAAEITIGGKVPGPAYLVTVNGVAYALLKRNVVSFTPTAPSPRYTVTRDDGQTVATFGG